MSDDNKKQPTFIPEKETQNTEKYRTITTGVRQSTVDQQTSVNTESLRDEMREKVGTTTQPITDDLASALSNPLS